MSWRFTQQVKFICAAHEHIGGNLWVVLDSVIGIWGTWSGVLATDYYHKTLREDSPKEHFFAELILIGIEVPGSFYNSNPNMKSVEK